MKRTGPRPFVFVDEPRYVVQTKFDPTQDWTLIYQGDNRERAVEVANFWDEVQDTEFIDRHEHDGPLSMLFRKFDALIEHVLSGGFG